MALVNIIFAASVIMFAISTLSVAVFVFKKHN